MVTTRTSRHQDKDYTLIHIENRLRAETGSHLTTIRETATTDWWFTWGTLGVVGFAILGYLAHYCLVQLPKRTTQVEMQTRHEDKIYAIEDTLITHDYMPATKRKKKGRKKSRKTQGRRKEQEKEEQGDETE